jgi:hypothetical protein
LRRILPAGRRSGNEWTAINPTRSDRRAGSFRVNVVSGKWADFATGDKGGDVISLVAYITDCSQLEGAQKLRRMLSLDGARRHG